MTKTNSTADSNALDKLWETLAFPAGSQLGQRVSKKFILENADLHAADRKTFRSDVERVYWQYTLKPATCPVLPYKDLEREYLEIAVLQVELRAPERHKRIAEIVHRTIPYPLFLVLNCPAAKFALSIAPKRNSQVKEGVYVVEELHTSNWLESANLRAAEVEFIQSLAWQNLPLQTYASVYAAWIDRFIAFDCAAFSGVFRQENSEQRLARLARCRQIEANIIELRAQIKDSAFSEQVVLNTQIKSLERELDQLAVNL